MHSNIYKKKSLYFAATTMQAFLLRVIVSQFCRSQGPRIQSHNFFCCFFFFLSIRSYLTIISWATKSSTTFFRIILQDFPGSYDHIVTFSRFIGLSATTIFSIIVKLSHIFFKVKWSPNNFFHGHRISPIVFSRAIGSQKMK